MEINRNNYELYMIDYLDAKLSNEHQAKLMLFLAENPDLQAEFDLLQHSIIADDAHPIPFAFKEELKKQECIQVSQYDELLVAKLEGDLDHIELAKLDAEMHVYPELQTSFEQFQKTKLSVEETIVFGHKSSLKKEAQVFVLFNSFRMVSSVAATFLIILALWFFQSNKTGNTNTAAINNTNEIITKQNKQLANSDNSNKHIEPIKSNVVRIKVRKTKSIDPALKASSIERVNMAVAQIETKEISPKAEILVPIIEKEIRSIQYTVKAKSNDANMVATNNYLTPQEYLQKMINANAQNTVIDQNKPKNPNDKNKSNIGFALLGLFNKATGSDVKLVRRYDNDGNLTGYSVAANTLFANSR